MSNWGRDPDWDFVCRTCHNDSCTCQTDFYKALLKGILAEIDESVLSEKAKDLFEKGENYTQWSDD